MKLKQLLEKIKDLTEARNDLKKAMQTLFYLEGSDIGEFPIMQQTLDINVYISKKNLIELVQKKVEALREESCRLAIQCNVEHEELPLDE